jgi:hypothetical protein
VVKDSRSAPPVTVTADGRGVVSHAGVGLLGELADRSGLTGALSALMARHGHGFRSHDPGVVLAQVAVAIADGATNVSQVCRVVSQRALLAGAGTYSTVSRAIWRLDELECYGLDAAVAVAREGVWAAAGGFDALTIDVDATLVDAHSDKEGAAPTYKGGFGLHPLAAFVDETGEVLAGMLRPGNAGSNTVEDHCDVLARGIDALPARYRAGHLGGDDPALAQVPILVRADAAGATHGFVAELAARNVGFSVGYQITARVQGALCQLADDAWRGALDPDAQPRTGAQVAEVHGVLNRADWPEATRLIVRRERPHPGAAHKLSLFDELTGWRHTAFLTDTPGDSAELELRHRRHARVEDRIRGAKDTGWRRFPSAEFRFNEAWLALAGIAINLLAWAQLVCFDGALARAEPATLRYQVLHVAARLTRRSRRTHLRIDRRWPWATHLARAYTRLRHRLTG